MTGQFAEVVKASRCGDRIEWLFLFPSMRSISGESAQRTRPMKALDNLKQDHLTIERVLDLLEQAGNRVRTGHALPAGFERWAVDTLCNFADHCHHAKEETALFPLLEARGITREGGPLGVMLREHEQGRTYRHRMQDAVDRRDH